MASTSDNEVERLRREAEKALRRSRRTASVERALQRLLDRAEEGSDDSLYARRHLAELQLESNPWNAALHLRRVIQSHGSDDVLHALMGLAQALLGNYQAAARAYQRALKLAPENPWYHHNLGHLLDVALMKPARAEHHLRRAYQMEPEQDEIAASLAHCLARIHQMNEAEELARQAL
ncbi:MAG: tetratricopeptide repeat protein, partial [Myxococcota bacterium]